MLGKTNLAQRSAYRRVPFLNGDDSQLLGSEVWIKVPLGEVGGGVGMTGILGGEGRCHALCSGFGSWLLERGHLVGCTCMTPASMF